MVVQQPIEKLNMKDLLDKLGSYNLFNYLLPGVVFSALTGLLTGYSFVQSDLIVGAFVYYFLGLVISRIGSIFVEPALKRLKLVEFCSYQDYLSASKDDELIQTLSEANNMYRTFVSLFLCLLLLKVYELIAAKLPFFEEWKTSILVIGLFFLFLMSYRKQTAYINKRVHHKIPKD